MRIEEGKYYLNRDGECVGPMRKDERGTGLVLLDHLSRPYFMDGRARVGTETTRFDLVREWIDPNAPAQPVKVERAEAPPPIPPQYQNADRSYGDLVRILQEAHAQASRGKGRERHANGRPFDRQPIMELGRMFGPGFAAGQAAKKAQEAMGMIQRRNDEAAVAELLGAINYLAACVMLVREHHV